MRIIKGSLKGRKIQSPKNLPVRPTTDFAKEGLFNILENTFSIENKTILDLCFGTGNISLEFASRGAHKIRAIDKNYLSVKYLKSLTKELELSQIEVYKNTYINYLKKYNDCFDIIFCDPPYDDSDSKKIPLLVFQNKLLNTDGILILEHSKDLSFKEENHFLSQRTFGNVNFTFFKRNLKQ